MINKKNLKKLHQVLNNIIDGKQNYNAMYNAVHKCDSFIINYFNGLVDFLAFDKPVIISKDLASLKIQDAEQYDEGEELERDKAREKRLQKESKDPKSIWFNYTLGDSLSYDNTLMVAKFLNIRLAIPLLGLSKYKPDNDQDAIKYYKNNINTTYRNDEVFRDYSISDKLDENDDTVGNITIDKYVRKLDKLMIKMIKQGKYNCVTDPEDIQEAIG